MAERTRLVPEPPELQELHSPDEEEPRREVGRRGSRRWLSLSLAGALLAGLALCLARLRGGRAGAGREEVPELEGETALWQEEAELDLTLLNRFPVREFEEALEEEDPPVWINRDPEVLNVSFELADEPPEEAPPRRLARLSCSERFARPREVSRQHLSPNSRDELFPPEMTSIAAPGANCGDTARGIHKSCDKYNHWRTFQELASATGSTFQVIGKEGPNWHDIGQGELGTCYFLAGLASIARTDPQVIEDMFIERHKWSQNIYTTRWLINGRVITVEVDNHIPATHYHPWFVQASSTGEWWPVILEKSWAKLHNTYRATEGGVWPNTVLAVTGAPVFRFHHEVTKVDALMEHMKRATENGWPMGAGTGSGCVKYGLSRGHAYSIFKVWDLAPYGTVVMVYNPWHHDHYKGRIPNEDKSDGVFTMTAREYHDAFKITSMAMVKRGYRVTAKVIQTVQTKSTAWEFDVSFSGSFSIGVNWPMVRGCIDQGPKVTLIVKHLDSDDEPEVADLVSHGIGAKVAKLWGGKGRYSVAASVSFPDGAEAPEASLVAYAPARIAIRESAKDPTLVLMTLFGAAEDGKVCRNVFVAEFGNFLLKLDETVNGFPTYWSANMNEFAYWVPDQKKWLMIQSSYIGKVRSGEVWSFAKFTKDSMSCGCKDDPRGIAGFNGVTCDKVVEPHVMYYNVKCHDTTHSDLVQQYCPVTCASDFCKAGYAGGAVPTNSPKRTPVTQKCVDEEPTHIKLNKRPAHCSQLKDLCQMHKFIEEKCCRTCSRRAEEGGVDDRTHCEDYHPPGLQDSSGRKYEHCNQLQGYCTKSHAVPERCCKTCQEAAAFKDVNDGCQDASEPNLKTKSGRRFTCKGWRPYCKYQQVKEECCKTCTA